MFLFGYVLFALLIFGLTGLSLATKVIIVSGLVFGFLQLVKQMFPKLGGIYAVALNVALSVLSMVMAGQPGDLLSWQFWGAVLIAALGAAGLHGTYRSAAGPPSPPSS